MSSMRFLFILPAMLAAGTALAQAPGGPPPPATAPTLPGPACAAERANVEAEETTLGYLGDLMREALAACLAAAERSQQGSGR